MNIPNMLTLFRIALIPVFVLVFFLPFHWSYMASAVIFVLASLTDWLDGYLARRLDQSTSFGAFLDPVADKLMVVIALVLLVTQQDTVWFTVPALVVVGREILVSALREWMAEIGKRTSVAVSYLGKVKTFLQMIAIIVSRWAPRPIRSPCQATLSRPSRYRQRPALTKRSGSSVA